MLLIEKSVENAPAEVVEPIAKRVLWIEVVAAWRESVAKGEVVAIPVVEATLSVVKYEVEDAWRPAWNQMGVEVEFAVEL